MGKKCNDQKNVEDNETLETEEDSVESVFDSILSTCCCYGDSDGRNSLMDKDKNRKNKEKQQQQEADDDSPKFWERLSEVALFLIGGAPPVKFVKCFECTSVDESEVTMPRALSELANEYDNNNKWRVQSMWGISDEGDVSTHPSIVTESPTDGHTDEYLNSYRQEQQQEGPTTIIGNNGTRMKPLQSGSDRGSSSRWDRLKLVRTNSTSSRKSKKRNNSNNHSRSVVDGALSNTYTDSPLSTMNTVYGPDKYTAPPLSTSVVRKNWPRPPSSKRTVSTASTRFSSSSGGNSKLQSSRGGSVATRSRRSIRCEI